MPTPRQSTNVLSPALEIFNNMANVHLLWGPSAIGPANIVNTNSTGFLTASDRALAQIFNVKEDGNITDVGFLITAENGTSPAFNVGVVTLDSSGRPTTTAYGGSAITSAQWTSAGWKWVTLSTPAAASAGDFVATHLYPTGTPPDASNNISVSTSNIAQGPRGLVQSGGSWTASTMGIPMAMRYDTGAVYGFAVTSNTLHLTYNSGSSPNEVGLLGQFPVRMGICGARIGLYASGYGSAATYDVTLYDANSNVLAVASISDKDFTDDLNYVDVFWDTVYVNPHIDHRLGVKATTGTNGNITMMKWVLDSADARAAWPEGKNWQWTDRAGGAWTDDPAAMTYAGFWVSVIEFTSQYGMSV